MGLMNGMLNNCFYPENPLTIAEGIAVAVRAYESIHPEAVQPALPAETDPSAEGAPEMEGTAETGAETPPGDAESPTEDAENAPQAVPDSGDQADGEVPWYKNPWYWPTNTAFITRANSPPGWKRPSTATRWPTCLPMPWGMTTLF